MFKTGCVFLCVASVMACLHVLVFTNVPDINNHFLLVISAVIVLVVSFLGIAGLLACFITSLQLSLDQMPDASTANITSFISWFVCCIFAGVWVSNVSYSLFSYCIKQVFFFDIDTTSFKQIYSLFPVLCMAIVLCSDFLLSPKWLIIEPKSLQSLKIIYQVLKFAKKNKAPVNRSALTYWEEDIPSRIELGKSKYGGPFTTEQVEDVKTILRMLVMSVPWWITLFSFACNQGVDTVVPVLGLTNCESYSLALFTYSQWWCSVIGAVVYEFGLYPVIKNKLPSIMKRIGAASFLVVLLNIFFLILSVVVFLSPSANDSLTNIDWRLIIQSITFALLSFSLLTSIFEFVCAQSPYNTRGLVSGYAIFVYTLSVSISFFQVTIIRKLCDYTPYCYIIHTSLAAGLSVIGFLLHCILARWYKRRVRDDVYTPHRLVEEVYDRYLSART